MTQLIVSLAIGVGVLAGLGFGTLITETINRVDKRARARAAWEQAWRSSAR